MKSVVVVEIPIPSYYNEWCSELQIKNLKIHSLTYLRLHFENYPTKDEVLKLLRKLDEEAKEINDIYIQDFVNAIESTELVKEWKLPKPVDYYVSMNTFIEHPYFGRVSYNWEVKNVY